MFSVDHAADPLHDTDTAAPLAAGDGQATPLTVESVARGQEGELAIVVLDHWIKINLDVAVKIFASTYRKSLYVNNFVDEYFYPMVVCHNELATLSQSFPHP